MSIKRDFSLCVLGCVAFLFSPLASASLEWNFNQSGLVFDPSTPSAEYTYSAGAGQPNVNVSGWSDEGSLGDTGANTLTSQSVTNYSGGLGIDRPGEFDPEHSIDNNGPDEMILFEFSSDVTLTEIQAGWAPYDSDIVLLAYTGSGTPDLAGFEYATESDNTYDPNDTAAGNTVGLTQDGWELVGTYQNIGTSPTNVNDYDGSVSGTDAVSSSYWLVGAFNATVDPANSNLAGAPDYLKLTMVAGGVTPPPPPPNGMPVPSSLLLFALGVPAIRLARRK